MPYNTKKNSKHQKAHLVFQSFKHIVWEKILYNMQRKMTVITRTLGVSPNKEEQRG